MSNAPRYLAMLSLLLVGGPVWSQTSGTGDLLEETKRREQAAAQKAEADFRAALLDLHRLGTKDPARAAERLEKLLTTLEEDTVISPSKREGWRRMVKDRIRVLRNEGAEQARSDAEQADRAIKTEERRGAADQKAQREEKTRADLDAARKLHNDGKAADATRAAADASRRNPDNAAATAGSRITSGKQAIDQMRELRQDNARRRDLAMLEVERSATLPKGDIEFPSPEKWREITKRRTKSNMTETEKAIMKALESPISVNFKGSTFETALDYLQALTGQTILVDKATLEAAGVNYDTPVNTQARNLAMRTLLRKMLGQFNLTYVVKDQAIQIVSPEKAKEMMSVRTYYLGDMAGAVDFRFGPAITAMQMANNVNQLIQMITSSIEPDSWALNNQGGRGTIFFDGRTMSLVIKQSAEVHYMLGGFGK